MKISLWAFFAAFTLLIGCSKNTPLDLKGLDTATFEKDRGGCLNQRQNLIEELKKRENLLLGASQNQIAEALGRYDFQILDERNQKVYVYFLEKGPHCEFIQNPSQAQTLALHFSAISLVKKVTYQRGTP